MLIALDIGNYSINIGFFTRKGLFVKNLYSHPIKNSEGYASIIRGFLSEISVEKNTLHVIICSVVSSHTEVLIKACKSLIPEELFIVSNEMKTGLIFDITKPEELGSDRIANAVAAYEMFTVPVAALDFGTATTITIVGKDAHYIGGAIMPGLGLMNKSLSEGTSKLPKVSLCPPVSALGTNTEGCIQSGIFYGTAGAVERLLQEIEEKVGFKLKVIVTGGHGSMISRFLKRKHTVRENLTLEGLKILYMRNKSE